MVSRMDDTHTLADGTRLVVRDIRPDDAPKLRQGFHALSQASRYQRFMGQVADLTPSMLEYLTRVDGVDHVALVALRLDPGEREQELVGVARSIRDERRPHAAEVAITIADELQGRGLGTCMLQALVQLDRARAIDLLLAHALPSNGAIRRLLSAHGELREVEGVLQLRLDGAPHGLAAIARRVTSVFPALRMPKRAA